MSVSTKKNKIDTVLKLTFSFLHRSLSHFIISAAVWLLVMVNAAFSANVSMFNLMKWCVESARFDTESRLMMME